MDKIILIGGSPTVGKETPEGEGWKEDSELC